jgi:hypothetical protein
MFSGQLAIGQINLAQGELLAEQQAASRPTGASFQDAVARPLPAT